MVSAPAWPDYIAGGIRDLGLETATRNFQRLDLSRRKVPQRFHWRCVVPWPGPSRAFCIAVAQSTFSTSMNSTSTAYMTDFTRPAFPELSDMDVAGMRWRGPFVPQETGIAPK